MWLLYLVCFLIVLWVLCEVKGGLFSKLRDWRRFKIRAPDCVTRRGVYGLSVIALLFLSIIFSRSTLCYGAACSSISGGDSTDKIVIGDYSTTPGDFDCHCISWKNFWDNLSAVGSDVDVYVDAGLYTETVAPAVVTEVLTGVIHIRPRYKDFLDESDCGDGVRFVTDYSASDEFLHLNMSGEGFIIIEGISVDVSSGTSPTSIIYNNNTAASSTLIRKCSFKGSGSYIGISHYHGNGLNLGRYYDNFMYDLGGGFSISSTLGLGGYIGGNTLYDCTTGIAANSINLLAFNNLVTGGTNNFTGISNASGWNNLCSDSTCADANWGTDTLTLRPEGDVSGHVDFSPQTGSDNYAMVDETGSCTANDYNLITDADPDIWWYDYLDLDSGGDDINEEIRTYPIKQIVVKACLKGCCDWWDCAYGSCGEYELVINIGDNYCTSGGAGECADTWSSVAAGLTTTATEYSWTKTTNPADSEAWEWPDIDSLEIGCGGAATDPDTGNADFLWNYQTSVDVHYYKAKGNQVSKTVTFTDAASDDYSTEDSDVLDLGIGDHSSYDVNLVAHWKFDYEDFLDDASDNQGDLDADSTTPEVTSGIVSSSGVSFANGEHCILDNDDLVGIPGVSGASDMTICTWYNAGVSTGDNGIVSLWGPSSTAWLLRRSGTNIDFFVGDGTSVDSLQGSYALTCDASEWYHICASWDNSEKFASLCIYEESTDSVVELVEDDLLLFAMNESCTGDLGINSQAGGLSDYSSKHDDTRIYNRLLSPTQMSDIRKIRYYQDGLANDRYGNYDIGAYEKRNTFYVSEVDGLDSNTGLTELLAWKTLDKVHKSVGAGDTVLFKRDSVWEEESLSLPSSKLTIGSYGTGSNPKFDLNESSTLEFGITAAAMDDIYIDGIDVQDFRKIGIGNWYGNRWTIKNCSISTTYDVHTGYWTGAGIFMWSYGADADNADYVYIEGNTIGQIRTNAIQAEDYYPLIYYGICTWGYNNVTIIDNVVNSGNGTTGITIDGDATVGAAVSVEDILIQSNAVDGTYLGIRVGINTGVGSGGTGVSVINNYLANGTRGGLWVHQTTTGFIYGNHIHGGGGSGINLNAGDDGVDVVYNLIYDRGIYYNTDTGEPQGWNGIDISNGATNCKIYQNTVYKVAGCCMTLENHSGESDDCWHNTMYNNLLDASANIPANSNVMAAILYDEEDVNFNSDYNILLPATSGTCSPNKPVYKMGTGVGCKTLTEWQDLLETTYGQTDYEDNSYDSGSTFADVSANDYSLDADSNGVDGGKDLASYFSGLSLDYLDFCGNSVPVDGDKDTSEEPDIGSMEYSEGFLWGAGSSTDGYHNDGWTGGGWAPGTNAEILTDDETGKLSMDDTEFVLGPVKDFGSTAAKLLELEWNTVTGVDGTICWRGSSTSFEVTSSSLDWTEYSSVTRQVWRYVQIGVINAADCSGLP